MGQPQYRSDVFHVRSSRLLPSWHHSLPASSLGRSCQIGALLDQSRKLSGT
jgi:hypothetical protein